MKKFLKFSIMIVAMCIIFPFGINAALTPKQQKSVVDFTENFITEGNKRRILQYGNVNNFLCLQSQLVHCNSITRADGTKVLWMMREGGYSTYNEYAADIGYIKEGDYLSLSCVTFCSLVYKHTLGFRLDYASSGHLSNWPTEKFKENPLVTTYDGKESINLFEVVYSKQSNSKMAMLTVDSSLLQPGDIIVGRCDQEGYGHAVLSGGGDVIYQASMVPYINKDGSYSEFLIRKDNLSNLKNLSYTDLKIYRISDGILDPEFEGYNEMFDFDTLSLTKSNFDTTRPLIKSVEINSTPDKYGQYSFTVYATDEFGEGNPITLADDKSVVMRGNGTRQSGVLGFYYSSSPNPPTEVYDKKWINAKTNTLKATAPAGEYYLWAKDAAGNYSARWKIILGNEISAVLSLEDGDEGSDIPQEIKNPPVAEWNNPFTDVNENSWFYDDVKYANQNKLFTGVTDTAFAPDEVMTRAMLATALWRMEGSPKPKGANAFTDLKFDWYLDAVVWAAENGIVNGYGDGLFGPDDKISREQIAAMLYRYGEYKKYNVTARADIDSYTDSNTIGEWAKDYMRWANAAGMITGRTSTTLAPGEFATRAEVAAILRRFKNIG